MADQGKEASYINRPEIWFEQLTVISSHMHPLSSHYATLINYNSVLPKFFVNKRLRTLSTNVNGDNVKKCVSVLAQRQVVNRGDQCNDNY